MVVIVFIGRVNDWSSLGAPTSEDSKAGTLRDLTATRRQMEERLSALRAEKDHLSLQRALGELQDFRGAAAAAIEKLPKGAPEAEKLEGFQSDAEALYQALQEVSSEEFPQVQESYVQVMDKWQLALRRARSMAAGSCTLDPKLAGR